MQHWAYTTILSTIILSAIKNKPPARGQKPVATTSLALACLARCNGPNDIPTPAICKLPIYLPNSQLVVGSALRLTQPCCLCAAALAVDRALSLSSSGAMQPANIPSGPAGCGGGAGHAGRGPKGRGRGGPTGRAGGSGSRGGQERVRPSEAQALAVLGDPRAKVLNELLPPHVSWQRGMTMLPPQLWSAHIT